MSVEDAGELLAQIHPELAALTHLGMMILQDADPARFGRRLTTKETRALTGVDGMIVDLGTMNVVAPVAEPRREARYECI